MKKPRLGTDPLDWIGGAKTEKKSSLSKQSKHKLPDKQDLQKKQEKKTSQKGLPDGWTRATFIIREDHLEKLKALAYWDRKQIKELVSEIIGSFLKGKNIKAIRSK